MITQIQIMNILSIVNQHQELHQNVLLIEIMETRHIIY